MPVSVAKKIMENTPAQGFFRAILNVFILFYFFHEKNLDTQKTQKPQKDKKHKKHKKHKNANKRISNFLPLRRFLSA